MKMTKQEIVDKVNDFLINRLEIDKELVHPDAELRMDIGLTSIDAIHVALFLKQTFGVQPVEEDLTSLVTLDDLYNYIEKHQTL